MASSSSARMCGLRSEAGKWIRIQHRRGLITELSCSPAWHIQGGFDAVVRGKHRPAAGEDEAEPGTSDLRREDLTYDQGRIELRLMRPASNATRASTMLGPPR